MVLHGGIERGSSRDRSLTSSSLEDEYSAVSRPASCLCPVWGQRCPFLPVQSAFAKQAQCAPLGISAGVRREQRQGGRVL